MSTLDKKPSDFPCCSKYAHTRTSNSVNIFIYFLFAYLYIDRHSLVYSFFDYPHCTINNFSLAAKSDKTLPFEIIWRRSCKPEILPLSWLIDGIMEDNTASQSSARVACSQAFSFRWSGASTQIVFHLMNLGTKRNGSPYSRKQEPTIILSRNALLTTNPLPMTE